MRRIPARLVFEAVTFRYPGTDAPTEHALFERFAAADRRSDRNGAITVVVSHRFSTVRMADLIVVLDQGRILDSGNHEELMQRRGHYAELYTLQAKAYRVHAALDYYVAHRSELDEIIRAQLVDEPEGYHRP